MLPLLIPALLLVGLWGHAASGYVGEGLGLRAGADLTASAGEPVHAALARLQDERRLTAVWQASPTDSSRAAVETARENTDTAVGELQRALPAARESAGAEVRSGVGELNGALEGLPDRRDAIDERTAGGAEAFRYYTRAVAEGTDLLEAMTRSDDGHLARRADAVTSLVRASEMLSREDALLSGALASGRMTSAAHRDFDRYLAVQRQIRTVLDARDLPAEEADAYRRLTGTPQWASLASVEDAVATRAAALPRQADRWREAADAVGGDLREVEAGALRSLADAGSSRADALLWGAALGTAAVVAALAVAGVLARRAWHSLAGRLSRLRRTAEEAADVRLPRILEQLGRGELVESADQPPGPDDGTDEVGRLDAAIRHLERTARTAAVQQVRGWEGTEKVFANLTRRTQSLIHRLISLLDDLERKHEDSDLLKDIFKVDHLATRVRRHSENLVILGGFLPTRRWSTPVPLIDVLRSAVSETEEYTRVKVQPLPRNARAAVAGRAVADVTHLLAEIIENGTAFSPPDTQVTVSAKKVAKGLALHIEDHGLGMTEEGYERTNELLARPPKPDMMTLGEDPRLGLFVVARLAERHGLRVSLRESPYGGTLAVVLLPEALLEEAESPLSGIPGLPLEAGETAPAGDGGGGTVVRIPLDDHRGYPAYGGAGLLPAEPGALAGYAPVSAVQAVGREDAGEGSAPPLPAVSAGPSGRAEPTGSTEQAGPSGHAEPTGSTGDRAPHDASDRPAPSRSLPRRVRGENLAKQLRGAPPQPHLGRGDDTQTDASSPDRSAAAMAAIQRETGRARRAEAEGHADARDPRAEPPGRSNEQL